jgi:hypothetical protein
MKYGKRKRFKSVMSTIPSPRQFSHNVKELYFKYRDKKLQNKKPEHFLCSGLDISFNNFYYPLLISEHK